ncbi:hypothetical protein [Gemmata sp.]|uniref:hypothetical protein n=1 Tax=Gemmata sp. TaxID=1914242 RepID=UPI003F7052BB
MEFIPAPSHDGPVQRESALRVGLSVLRADDGSVGGARGGRAVVLRPATSKSLGDPGLLDQVRLVPGRATFDVAHFNKRDARRGDTETEVEYAKAIPELVAAIRKGAPGAELVRASATPVRVAGSIDRLDPRTDRVEARNTTAAGVTAGEKTPTDDLLALAADTPDLFSKDGVRLDAGGSTVPGERAAAEATGLSGDSKE